MEQDLRLLHSEVSQSARSSHGNVCPYTCLTSSSPLDFKTELKIQTDHSQAKETKEKEEAATYSQG